MKIINEEIKREFYNKGITLIALVITIIVLLILNEEEVWTHDANKNNGFPIIINE